MMKRFRVEYVLGLYIITDDVGIIITALEKGPPGAGRVFLANKGATDLFGVRIFTRCACMIATLTTG